MEKVMITNSNKDDRLLEKLEKQTPKEKKKPAKKIKKVSDYAPLSYDDIGYINVAVADLRRIYKEIFEIEQSAGRKRVINVDNNDYDSRKVTEVIKRVILESAEKECQSAYLNSLKIIGQEIKDNLKEKYNFSYDENEVPGIKSPSYGNTNAKIGNYRDNIVAVADSSIEPIRIDIDKLKSYITDNHYTGVEEGLKKLTEDDEPPF